MIGIAFVWLAFLTFAHLAGMRNVHNLFDILQTRVARLKHRVDVVEKRTPPKDDRPFAHLTGEKY